MNKIIFTIVVVFGLSACDYASQLYEKTKRQTIDVSNTVSQKVNDAGKGIANYQNQIVDDVTNSIKTWLYEVLEPAFPWIFLISFLLLFGALKTVIPFSNFVAIQIPILVVSYGSIFSLFYKLEIVIFAIEATFWFLTPIIIFSLGLYLSRKTLLPKIKSFNDKIFNTGLTDGGTQ